MSYLLKKWVPECIRGTDICADHVFESHVAVQHVADSTGLISKCKVFCCNAAFREGSLQIVASLWVLMGAVNKGDWRGCGWWAGAGKMFSHAYCRHLLTSCSPVTQCLSCLSFHQHTLDGQRCLWACEQRCLLQLVRSGRECPSDRAGGAGYPRRGHHRPGDRNTVQLFCPAGFSANGGSRHPCGAHRVVERALRSGAVRCRRGAFCG